MLHTSFFSIFYEIKVSVRHCLRMVHERTGRGVCYRTCRSG